MCVFLRAVTLCVILLLQVNYIIAKHNDGKYRDVHTSGGIVRGRVASDGNYYAYLGIPYALPPTGKKRFKAPFPPQPWEDIYEANRTVMCPQMGQGEEDCLVLNVFVPSKIQKKPMPVLFYIHGGAFIVGVGQTKGMQPLIKQNIIVVTINYRLGALGFLCLGIEEAPGNAGLKDQIAALKWVRNNIRDFGGDPNQVTIYGLSAGGASVEYLVLSKLSKGLFQRAVVESASATSVWSIDANPIITARSVAAALQFTKQARNLYRLANFYRHVPSDKLSKTNFEYFSNLTDGTFGFVPCVERHLFATETFIDTPPYEILIKENFNKVPIMFSFVALEGLFFKSEEYYTKNYKERLESHFSDFLPADLVFDTKEIKDEIAKNIKHFYFGNRTVGDNTIIEYLNFFGDYYVLHGLLNSVQLHSRKENPVYLLEFAYRGNMGGYDQFYENITLAGHGDIIKHAILVSVCCKSTDDKITVNRVAKLIGNYVKFGNPIPNRTPLLPILWPTVHPANITYLRLDRHLEVLEEPHWGRKVFWDKLYAKLRRRIKPVDIGLL